MSEQAYIPAGGLTGKLKRLQARLVARDPIALPERPIVSFTFDDFPKSAVDEGASALESRGWLGSWYAAMGFAGETTHHGPMFDAGDIGRLNEAGHEIACHSWSHLDTGQAPLETVLDDTKRNALALEGLGVQIDNFAYPYGEASPASKRALGMRYSTQRGVQPGINYSGADRRLLKAVGIDGGDDGIATAINFARSLDARPGWLIYYIHDVQDDPTPWGCTPAQLNTVMDAVGASGADVLTVRDALKTVR